MTTFGGLALQVASDPYILDNQGWNTQMTSVLSQLQTSARLIREIQPVPSSLEHIHADMEEMATLIDSGIDAFGRGLENLDPELVLTGNQLFQQSTGVRNSVSQRLSNFCG